MLMETGFKLLNSSGIQNESAITLHSVFFCHHYQVCHSHHLTLPACLRNDISNTVFERQSQSHLPVFRNTYLKILMAKIKHRINASMRKGQNRDVHVSLNNKLVQLIKNRKGQTKTTSINNK